MIGVVYKFKPHNKLNGTLFYCYEYYRFLKTLVDVKFYIVGITDGDRQLINKVFSEKYVDYVDEIVPVQRIVDLYRIKLQQTLILDVHTFYMCKEFLTGRIHCFSNETHDMYKYKDLREVIFYGIYSYQRYNVKNMLKLNFDIFKPCETKSGVFISCLDQTHLKDNIRKYEKQFDKPIILKQSHSGQGNLFDLIDHVHYVHVQQDTNNRIIPEAFHHNKTVTIEEVYTYKDSIRMRYDDILENGLSTYTLTYDDEMVKACLQSCS